VIALAELTVAAHGGLERWKRLNEVSAHLIVGAALWALKDQPNTISDTTVAVGTKDAASKPAVDWFTQHLASR
jgi:hypothetical protein